MTAGGGAMTGDSGDSGCASGKGAEHAASIAITSAKGASEETRANCFIMSLDVATEPNVSLAITIWQAILRNDAKLLHYIDHHGKPCWLRRRRRAPHLGTTWSTWRPNRDRKSVV